MTAEEDLLLGAAWECASAPAGSILDPADLGRSRLEWLPATVPGTAAAALRTTIGDRILWHGFDDSDWWFRTSVDVSQSAGDWVVEIGGIATLADVWIDGSHILHSENMFLAHRLDVGPLSGTVELVIRCAALSPVLAKRRPRPRWRSPRLVHQNLRWIRTTLLGRLVGWVATPPPVGPWRPICLVRRPAVEILSRSIHPRCDDSDGATVDLELTIRAEQPIDGATVTIAGVTSALDLTAAGGDIIAKGQLALDSVERWWPHSHGSQPMYDVTLSIAGVDHSLGRIGFRTVKIDRTDNGFTLVVNGTPVYCRGACWMPPDPITMSASPDELRRNLELFLAAGLNMVRVVGEVAYESEAFLDLCDELGVLLWQDVMLAFFDAPDDDAFRESLSLELRQVFAGLQGRPSLAVVCGGSDTEEQAQFMGGAPGAWTAPIAYEQIPALLDQLLPGVPYVASSPGESPLPTMINQGVAHYYGVGAYTRPLGDTRRANVRFAAECLAFATPPEPLDTGEVPAIPRPGMGHHAEWKNAIHNDAHASWDQEDVRDFYTSQIFDVDLFTLRHHDPERAMALGRATSAYVFDYVLSEWRRAGSGCAGSLVFNWRDLRFGAGLGVIDSHGRPKASWYAMRRVMQPVAVLLTDEGLNGLGLHLVNDGPTALPGTVRLELIVNGELRLEPTEVAVEIPPRGGCSVETGTLLGGFRDLSYAHQFGKPAYDAVVATLFDETQGQISQAAFLPGAAARPVERDLGLTAEVAPAADGGPDWTATVACLRFAQWVFLDVPGYLPMDGWFHLPPGETRVVRLAATEPGQAPPKGTVNALNLGRPVRLTLNS